MKPETQMMKTTLPLLLLLFVAACSTSRPDPDTLQEGAIHLNQIGFYPDGPKQAVVQGAAEGTFEVIAENGERRFTGQLSSEEAWEMSGERVRVADFSDLDVPGVYRLRVPGVGDSDPFEIKRAVLSDLTKGILKGFYYQRASSALPEAYAGRWARAAGHPDDKVMVHPSAASPGRPAGTILSMPKGWYDAGDYNKYIVNSGITTGTLLALYEQFPAFFDSFSLNIPESGGAMPDLLDEALWNLRWMMAMQDPADGGVYHKLTTANFEGMVRPDQARAQRYVVQKSTAAALDFAAVMARAARVYRGRAGVPGLADSMLTAAASAWDWAAANPSVPYRQNEMNSRFDPDVATGAYDDEQFEDEFAWAAAELYATTKDARYLDGHDPRQISRTSVPSWGNVQAMALMALLDNRDAVDAGSAGAAITSLADELVQAQRASAYRMPFGAGRSDFAWGSTAVAANQGLILLQAYRLTGDQRYFDAAVANLDYLLGRNPLNLTFVTGFGDRSPMHPHHRPSVSDGIDDPVPGMLVGGPNPGMQDAANCSTAYPSKLPALAYLDNDCSYASNEIAINWQASIAYLAGAIEALEAGEGM